MSTMTKREMVLAAFDRMPRHFIDIAKEVGCSKCYASQILRAERADEYISEHMKIRKPLSPTDEATLAAWDANPRFPCDIYPGRDPWEVEGRNYITNLLSLFRPGWGAKAR